MITTNEKLKDAIALLEIDDINTRRKAAKSLCYIARYGEIKFSEALPALTSALEYPDDYTKQMAAQAIGRAAEFNVQIPEDTIAVLRKIRANGAPESVKRMADDALVACGKLQRRTGRGETDQLKLFADRRGQTLVQAYALLRRATPRPQLARA